MVDKSDLEKEESFEDSNLSEDQRELVQEWLCSECGGLKATKRAINRADLSKFDQCSCEE